MTPYYSLTQHPLYPRLQPFICVLPAKDSKGKQVRVRIELRKMPISLAVQALKIEVLCPACGDPHHPIRRRRGPNRRVDGDQKGMAIYYASTCPLSDSISCSRGRAASREYNLIEQSMKAWKKLEGSKQGDLFS